MGMGRMTRWIGCVATVFALAAGPTALRAETLADALKSAYLNSGLLDQNRALLRAADEDVAQAVAGLRPIIDWTADIRRNFQAQHRPVRKHARDLEQQREYRHHRLASPL